MTLVTCLLVAGAIWLDRDRPAPAGAYGIVPQPGAATVAAPAPLEVGDMVPNFRLRSTDGTHVELASLRGQPVILTFWTTWCLACLDQLPAMQQVAGAHGDVRALGIAVGEPSGRVSSAADDHGATFPMLLDSDKAVAHTYGYWDYPVTLVIDADGVITAIHSGPVSAEEMEADINT
jgi:peroxiredoxin